MWFLVVLAVLALAVAAYRFRVPILARVLGQPERRVARRLDKPKG